MNEKSFTDLSEFSFDEFIAFLFDRDIPEKSGKWNPWYWHTEVVFDPVRICDYYIRLFKEPRFLLERFSPAQLEEGFWAISSHGFLGCSATDLFWNEVLPLSAREECVRSMFYLYRDLFAFEPSETAGFMWWDSVCWHLWHRGQKDRLRGGEDLSMQDVMFETLAKILALDSENCQHAALHGLGHLQHPATQETINDYLRQHPSLSHEIRIYALAAARFEVQ
jgi:hypothetical protein